jgi:ribonuclease HI
VNESKFEVQIYTDGACEMNPGPGGWATLLVDDTQRRALSGGFRRTTNNRMELMAVIEGLRALKGGPRRVQVVSDSKYVTEAVNQGWLTGWAKAGFRKSKGTRENADLWIQLLELLGRHAVAFEWVKGHAEHPENEECDRLAVAARRAPDLPADIGYEEPDATNIGLGLTML